MDNDIGQMVLCRCVCNGSVLPVQLKSQCPVDGSKTQQADPSQQDAAENTWLEVENPDLQWDREKVKGGPLCFWGGCPFCVLYLSHS